MEYQLVAREFVATLALLAPYLVTMIGLYWLNDVIWNWIPWGPRGNTRELMLDIVIGVCFMAAAIKHAVGVVFGPRPIPFEEELPVLFTAIAVLILLDATYRRVKGAIKRAARSSG